MLLIGVGLVFTYLHFKWEVLYPLQKLGKRPKQFFLSIDLMRVAPDLGVIYYMRVTFFFSQLGLLGIKSTEFYEEFKKY